MRAMGDAIRGGTYAGIELLRPLSPCRRPRLRRAGATWASIMRRRGSCYVGGEMHCGECGTCVERREAFLLAGVADPTPYLSASPLPPKTGGALTEDVHLRNLSFHPGRGRIDRHPVRVRPDLGLQSALLLVRYKIRFVESRGRNDFSRRRRAKSSRLSIAALRPHGRRTDGGCGNPRAGRSTPGRGPAYHHRDGGHDFALRHRLRPGFA